jgi:hypothetical protein
MSAPKRTSAVSPDIRQFPQTNLTNKDRLNDWLALLANIAVVAGIVFLRFELRQNNTLLRADASYVLLDNRTAGISELFRDPRFATTYIEARNGEEFLISITFIWAGTIESYSSSGNGSLKKSSGRTH